MAPNHGNSRWETESNLRAPIKSRNESNLPQKITRDQVRYNLMGHITEDRPGLLRFYPDPETLLGEDAGPEGQDIVERAYKTAQLATEMGVGSSVAMVLSLLALYDLVILANNSMAMEIRQGGAQIHNLRNILFEISKLYLPASTNNSGITGVVFPNSLPDYILKQNGLTQKNVFRDVKPDDMAGMFSQVQWAGFTALGIGMAEKVLSEFVSLGPEMKKPVIITTITDHPNEGEPMHYLKYQIWIQAVDLMRDHGNHGFQAISYQFAMIGNDIQAKDFLTTLKEEQTLEAFVDVMLSELDGIQVLTSRERKKSGLLLANLLCGGLTYGGELLEEYENYEQELDSAGPTAEQDSELEYEGEFNDEFNGKIYDEINDAYYTVQKGAAVKDWIRDIDVEYICEVDPFENSKEFYVLNAAPDPEDLAVW